MGRVKGIRAKKKIDSGIGYERGRSKWADFRVEVYIIVVDKMVYRGKK